jgi:hypothetical protein
MQNPPESDRQPPDQFGNRWIITGGSNGILYAFILAAAVLTLWRNQRYAFAEIKERDRLLISIHSRLMLSFLFALFLPQTLELRYYLYNLFVPCLVAISAPSLNLRRLMSFATLLGTAFALLSTILVPFYFWLRTNTWLEETVSWDVFHSRPPLEVCRQSFNDFSDEKRRFGRPTISTVKEVVICGFGDATE